MLWLNNNRFVRQLVRGAQFSNIQINDGETNFQNKWISNASVEKRLITPARYTLDWNWTIVCRQPASRLQPFQPIRKRSKYVHTAHYSICGQHFLDVQPDGRNSVWAIANVERTVAMVSDCVSREISLFRKLTPIVVCELNPAFVYYLFMEWIKCWWTLLRMCSTYSTISHMNQRMRMRQWGFLLRRTNFRQISLLIVRKQIVGDAIYHDIG